MWSSYMRIEQKGDQMRNNESVVYCKDCVKHNISMDDAIKEGGRYRPVFKEEVCPLVSFRGKAQGHEFDYQYCVCGKERC